MGWEKVGKCFEQIKKSAEALFCLFVAIRYTLAFDSKYSLITGVRNTFLFEVVAEIIEIVTVSLVFRKTYTIDTFNGLFLA